MTTTESETMSDAPADAEPTPNEPPVVPAPAAPEPSTEVAPFDPSTIEVADPSVGVLGLPSPNEWAAITGMSNAIARSGICPRDLRNKPDDVALVLLYGRDLMLPPTVALNRISVVEGRPTLDAALMLTLARRAGHRITPDPTNDRTKATAHIVLKDDPTGERHSFTFTIEDARAAGLCKIKDGKVEARSGSGKILPWEAYTQFMLWARAVSAIIRMTCPEVTMGVAYIPDELGITNLDEQGRIIDVADYRPASAPEPDPLDQPIDDDTLARIMGRISNLTVEQAAWARDTWKLPIHEVPGWDPPEPSEEHPDRTGWWLPIPKPGEITRRFLAPIDKLLTEAETYEPAAAPPVPADATDGPAATDAGPDAAAASTAPAADESHLPCPECFHTEGEHSASCSLRPFG